MSYNKIRICILLFFILINLVKADDLVSNVSIIINGTNIDLNQNLTINLSAGETIPIEVHYTGKKDIFERVKIRASMDIFSEVISNYITTMIQKDLNSYAILPLDLPNNIPTNNYILQIKFYSKDESQTINLNIHIDGADPLLINITSPLNNSIIYKKNLDLTVESNRDAICSYNIRKTFEPQEEDIFKNMSVVSIKNHYEPIQNLNNSYNESYYLFIDCVDVQNVHGIYKNNFHVNLSEPTITLNSPENAYSTKSNKIIFRYNTKDELSNIANCSLLIDNQIKETNSNITQDTENQFSLNLNPSDYIWKVICTNMNGVERSSESRELTIKTKKYT